MEVDTVEDEEDRKFQQVHIVIRTPQLWKHGCFILILNLSSRDLMGVGWDAEH